MKPDKPVLRRSEYVVEPVPLAMCADLVREYHYAGRGSNTATFRHGLFRAEDHMTCLGVAWWLPPTKDAAAACWPQDWRAVLALSRLVVRPDVPQNGTSFLLGRSVRLIRRDRRWECLVTYADEAEGHTGAVYLAAGWEHVGWTAPEARWVDGAGRMVSRKAGPVTRTAAEMRALGYSVAGASRKRRFRKVLRPAVRERGLEAS